MAIPWFKQILGSEKRSYRRWASGDVKKGDKRKREAAISEKIAAFKEEMDSKGIAFRDDRDAWEAYLDANPLAHIELTGGDVNQVLYDKGFQLFKGYWERLSKPAIVRFEGDGMIAMAPTLLTLGEGTTRMRANPIDFLKSNDPDERWRAVARIDHAIERCNARKDREQRRVNYLEKVRKGLQDGAIAIEKDGEIIVQGLLTAPEFEDLEDTDDDAE